MSDVNNSKPYVFLKEGPVREGPPRKVFHGLVAAQIIPKSFEVVNKHRQRFNITMLLEEIIARQRQFIEVLHPRDNHEFQIDQFNRTVSLRILKRAGKLSLCLVAKDTGDSASIARKRVLELMEEIRVSFSYDYDLVPFVDVDQFNNFSGHQVIQNIKHVIEIRRNERMVEIENGLFYRLYNFNNSLRGNEQFWRTMAYAPDSFILNIQLRPTILWEGEMKDMEVAWNLEQFSGLQQTDTDSVQMHKKNWKIPFLVQVHILADKIIPDMFPRTIGAGLTFDEKNPMSEPGYKFFEIEKNIEQCKDNLLVLEPHWSNEDIFDLRFLRLRSLFGVDEAMAAFRLPFLHKSGIEGVQFYGEG